MRNWAWAMMLLGGVAGCSGSKLETGYAPTKVGDTASQRRGYYASPFSPAAAEAKVDRDTEALNRRPRPGYQTGY